MTVKQRKQLIIKQLNFVATIMFACVVLFAALIYMFVLYKQQKSNVVTEVVTQVETVVIEKEVPKEVVVEVVKEPNYTYDELYCMAVVIYNEAGSNSCSDEHREFVGYVVLNRVNSDKYPDTIRDVLQQRGQYQCLWNNGIYFTKRGSSEVEIKALERAWSAAKKVLENRDNIPIPEDVVYQANFKQGSGVYKQIGNTYFCY